MRKDWRCTHDCCDYDIVVGAYAMHHGEYVRTGPLVHVTGHAVNMAEPDVYVVRLVRRLMLYILRDVRHRNRGTPHM